MPELFLGKESCQYWERLDMIATGSLSSLEVSRLVLCCLLKHRLYVQAILSMCDSRDSLPGLSSINLCFCDLKQVFNLLHLAFSHLCNGHNDSSTIPGLL